MQPKKLSLLLIIVVVVAGLGVSLGFRTTTVAADGGVWDVVVDEVVSQVNTPGRAITTIVSLPLAAASEAAGIVSGLNSLGACFGIAEQCSEDDGNSGFFTKAAGAVSTCLCAPKTAASYTIDQLVTGGIVGCGTDSSSGMCSGLCGPGTECALQSVSLPFLGDVALWCGCLPKDSITGGVTSPRTPGGNPNAKECEASYLGSNRKMMLELAMSGMPLDQINDLLESGLLEQAVCSIRYCPTEECSEAPTCVYYGEGWCDCPGCGKWEETDPGTTTPTGNPNPGTGPITPPATPTPPTPPPGPTPGPVTGGGTPPTTPPPPSGILCPQKTLKSVELELLDLITSGGNMNDYLVDTDPDPDVFNFEIDEEHVFNDACAKAKCDKPEETCQWAGGGSTSSNLCICEGGSCGNDEVVSDPNGGVPTGPEPDPVAVCIVDEYHPEYDLIDVCSPKGGCTYPLPPASFRILVAPYAPPWADTGTAGSSSSTEPGTVPE
ncbi:MAG: hypothetical protein KKA90_01375 [Nanoarchaeota archaeon]|nr:hypothetical protein [Nanoarchaeota archaeon]